MDIFHERPPVEHGHKREARLVVDELPEPRRCDYDQLVLALKQRFDPDGQRLFTRPSCPPARGRRMRAPPSLAMHSSRLAAKAYPSLSLDAREPWVIRQFIDGLADEHLTRHVGLKHPRSLEEAIAFAVITRRTPRAARLGRSQYQWQLSASQTSQQRSSNSGKSSKT